MMTAPAPPEGVLLLHGIFRRAASLARMERMFARAGFATLNLGYPARREPIEDLVERIAPSVAAFADTVACLHMATHSMGGLLARALITRRRPANLGRVVMLGPPNEGSELADLLSGLAPYRRLFGPAGAQLVTRRPPSLAALLGTVDYPLGIIAGDRSLSPLASLAVLPGPDDGRVTVARTKVAGMSAHVTLHATHALMMYDRHVLDEALHFVRFGRFARQEADGPAARDHEQR